MQPDNVVEERLGDRDGGVGMSKRDEVGVLGEAIDDGEDDGLAADPRKALDEIHSDVSPHRVRNVERLEEPRRVQVLRLVVLTSSAALDELPYLARRVWVVERRPQANESLLCALMAGAMRLVKERRPQGRLVWNEDAAAVHDETMLSTMQRPLYHPGFLGAWR